MESANSKTTELRHDVLWGQLHALTVIAQLGSFTKAGQRLVEETEASLAHITRTLGAARDAVGQARGLLRVTAPVALGRQHVAPALSLFFKQYPQIRIELDLSDRLVPLAQEGFDLAMRSMPSTPAAVAALAP